MASKLLSTVSLGHPSTGADSKVNQTTISPELRRLGRAGLGSSVNAKKKYKPGAILGGSATCRVCTVIYFRYLVRRR